MNQLTINHLAPYFPYVLRVERKSYKRERFKELSAYDLLPDGEIENLRLILRPLSDLTKEITHRGETFVPKMHLSSKFQMEVDVFNIPNVLDIRVCDYQKLCEWMFDTSGLIESGLAISVHDLGFNPYEK